MIWILTSSPAGSPLAGEGGIRLDRDEMAERIEGALLGSVPTLAMAYAPRKK